MNIMASIFPTSASISAGAASPRQVAYIFRKTTAFRWTWFQTTTSTSYFRMIRLCTSEEDVLRNYMWQLSQKLTKSGVAFLHHSNALGDAVDPQEVAANARATSVSASLVKEMIEDSGGKTLIQEEINWGTRTRIDCMTTFCREGAFAGHDYRLMENNDFMTEATLIRQFHSHYNLR